MEHRPTYQLTGEEVKRAIRHGVEMWYDDSSPMSDWDPRSNDRSMTKFVGDRVEGKVAEVAFMKFLEDGFGLEMEVDYEIYGDISITDDGDIESLTDGLGRSHPPAITVDVKKTKPKNMWLAVRESRWKEYRPTDVFVLCKTKIQRVNIDEMADETWTEGEPAVETWAEKISPLDVKICGFKQKNELRYTFDRGERLHTPDDETYEIGPPLKTKNKATPVKSLKAGIDDWNSLMENVVGDRPLHWSELVEEDIFRNL